MEELKMLVNFTEIILEDMFDEIIHRFPDFCSCDTCKEDVLCMALNKIPAMYYTSAAGRAYEKLLEYKTQFKVEVMYVLISSIQAVQRNPRCK